MGTRGLFVLRGESRYGDRRDPPDLCRGPVGRGEYYSRSRSRSHKRSRSRSMCSRSSSSSSSGG
eukprot:8822575-Pyramimonas_sp.AAC.1